jgi:hypothetical protein
MTTTQNINTDHALCGSFCECTNHAAIVAQMLLDHANKLSEEPFSGWDKDYARLGEQFARDAVDILAHYMLGHPELESEFPGLAQAASSWEAWQEFGS